MVQNKKHQVGKKKGKPTKTETKKNKFDWLKKLNPFKKSETEKK
jgi:membrane fusion protein (multidrug efflux system)